MDQVRQPTRRGLPLRTKELIAELNPLLRGWGEYYKRAQVRKLLPSGPSEYAQVFELAFCEWNLQKLYGWLLTEMAIPEGSAQAILKNVAESYDSEQIPVFAGGRAGAATQGWECQELLVQTASRTCDQEEGFGTEDVSKKSGQVLVHAKMTRTVDLILRYTADD
jgi:group II intron maturase